MAYADKYGFTLLKAMETELGGDAGNAGLFMLGMKLKPYKTIARLIKSACKGFGTDETLLTACLLRYHSVMKQVMEAFIEEYGETLQDVVKAETRATAKDLEEDVLDLGVATISIRPAVVEILKSKGLGGCTILERHRTEAPPFHNRFGAFCAPSSLLSSQKSLAGTKERDSQRARGAGEIIGYIMEGTVPLWRDNDTGMAPPLGICPFLRAQNA
eukprot:scaffold7395_cov175-Amphora_coffeaeformis.AAC.15